MSIDSNLKIFKILKSAKHKLPKSKCVLVVLHFNSFSSSGDYFTLKIHFKTSVSKKKLDKGFSVTLFGTL